MSNYGEVDLDYIESHIRFITEDLYWDNGFVQIAVRHILWGLPCDAHEGLKELLDRVEWRLQ